MSVAKADFAVIGGGIIGLTIARQLLLERPSADVVVLEKEPDSTSHASGRNSGVLHAGFYYAPDSLKARLTRRGNERLRVLYERGLANGVPVELIDSDRLRELEPLARTHELALWSPSTSVADPAAVVEALADDVVRLGGRIRYGSVVVAARPGELLVRAGGPGRGSAGHTSGSRHDAGPAPSSSPGAPSETEVVREAVTGAGVRSRAAARTAAKVASLRSGQMASAAAEAATMRGPRVNSSNGRLATS